VVDAGTGAVNATRWPFACNDDGTSDPRTSEETMSLKDAVAQFTESVVDLTELEVTTYTGTLEEAIDAKTGKIRWDDFRPTGGKLVLAAATRVRPNFETINYCAADMGSADMQALLAIHNAAVESAKSGRLALVKMFSGLLPTIPNE
jgi:hypothetical protein